MTYNITLGNSSKQTEWPPLKEPFTLGEILGMLTTEHVEREDKDGECYCPATFIKGPWTKACPSGWARHKTAVTEISLLVFDIDGSQTLEEVKALVEKSGLMAVVHTTHSHKSTTTEINANKYADWQKREPHNPKIPTAASMQRYLTSINKTHLTNIKFDGSKDYERRSDGAYWIVTHDPIDKCRVILPLESPIIMGDLDPAVKNQEAAYKSLYFGTAGFLGLDVDHSCSDPSRLYYLPSHKPGKPFDTCLYEGKLLDWHSMPRAALGNKLTKSGQQADEGEDWMVTDCNGVTFNLIPWVKVNGSSFEIANVLRNLVPDKIRREFSDGRDGFELECPFEEDHSTPGGNGCYVETNVDTGFVFRCRHDSCNTAGRSRLHFLKKMIEDGHVTAEDIGVDTTPVKRAAENNKVFSDLNIDPATLPIGVIDEDDPIDVSELPEDENVETHFSDKQQAYEDYVTQISQCRSAERAINAFRKIAQLPIMMTQEAVLDALVNSKLTVASVKKVIGTIRATTPWEIDGEELLQDVPRIRGERWPVSAPVAELIDEARSGSDLETRKKKLMDFYGLTKMQINREYAAQKEMKHEQDSVNHTLRDKEREFIKRYAKVVINTKGFILDMPATKRKGKPITLTSETMGLVFKSDLVHLSKDKDPKGKGKTMNLYDYCINFTPEMKTYQGITFDPRPGAGRTNEDGEFNTWFGFNMKPKIGDASLINEHIKDVWCGNADEHTYWWIRTFLAHIFQRPWEKPGSAVALGGPQGTGKSMPLEHGIAHMVHPYYAKSSRPDDICGQFSAFSACKIVFLSEEAVWSGDKKMLRQLKDRVTSETAVWEDKHLPKVHIPDFIRLFFTSNDPHIFDMESEDRRYCVLDTTSAHQNDLKYFGRMLNWFKEEGGREIWLNDLLNFKPEDHGITWTDLRTPPLTEARLRQVAMSRTPAAEFFVDILKNGRITTLPRNVELEQPISWPHDKEFVIQAETFRIIFDEYVRYFLGSSFRFERAMFVTNFKKYFGAEYKDMIKQRTDPENPGNKRARCLVLPPRVEMLRKLAAHPKPEFTQDDIQYAIDNPTSHQVHGA